MVPRGAVAFHLGIHNLPSATGAEWMRRMEAFTAIPVGERPAKLLTEMLAELDELPGVLIVFNHPLWDLYRIGEERHRFLVNDFLAVYGQFCHAVELNGLRNWDENRQVGHPRRAVEPGADQRWRPARRGAQRQPQPERARSFTEFVHEVRRDRQSHILFMPQYAEPWKHRILQLDAGRHPQLPRLPRGLAALGRSRTTPTRRAIRESSRNYGVVAARRST